MGNCLNCFFGKQDHIPGQEKKNQIEQQSTSHKINAAHYYQKDQQSSFTLKNEVQNSPKQEQKEQEKQSNQQQITSLNSNSQSSVKSQFFDTTPAVEDLLTHSYHNFFRPTIKNEDERKESIIQEADPFGLPNMGNTCYFNSMIQMMIHCSYSTNYWPKITNQSFLNKLNLIQLTNEKERIKKINKEIFQILTFENKEVSHQTGNDPIRVFSSIIENCKVEGTVINIKYPPSKLQNDYQYWVEDNSQIEFLFSSVKIAGIQCDHCKNFEILDESRNFMINIPLYQASASIQDSLSKVAEQKNQNYSEPIQPCSSCHKQRYFIKGFLKLPQFLVINLDQQIDVKQMEIEDNLKLYDSARETNVEYNLIGFISHPTFHYTYFRRENKNSQQWTHFNDDKFETVTSQPTQQKAKIFLYQANKQTRDPNIEFSLQIQNQVPNKDIEYQQKDINQIEKKI